MTDAGSRPDKLRLFFAARVPEEHLRTIDERLGPLRDRLEGARWVPVANQHITMKFLGSTPADRLEDVIAAAAALQVRPATVSLTVLGAFPRPTRARVMWVGVHDPTAVLTNLATGLDRTLRPLGFEPEERAFHPHLTLARFRAPRPLPDALPDVAVGLAPFPVDELVLFRSRLHPKGARYEVVEAVGLEP